MQIDAAFFLEFCCQIFNQTHIEVFTTKESITVGCQYFELFFTVNVSHFDNGNIESTTTQVVYRNGTVAGFFIQTISQSRSCWFVDNTFYFQTSDFTGVFGCLTLGVIEVRRNGNNRFRYFLAQVVFGSLFHFLQHFSRDLRWCHFFAFYFNPCVTVVRLNNFVRHHRDVFLYHVISKTTADQTLDSKQRVSRVSHRLTFCRLTYQSFVVSERNNGRRSTITFRVFNYFGFVTIQNRNTRVGGAQVDTNYLTHLYVSVLAACAALNL